MGLEAATLALGGLTGAVLGRWWAVALAVPAGLAAASAYSVEGFSPLEVGVLFGVAVAVALSAGVTVRNVAGRWARAKSTGMD